MMRAVGASLPLDWRLLVNGYLPEYAYERGAVDTRCRCRNCARSRKSTPSRRRRAIRRISRA